MEKQTLLGIYFLLLLSLAGNNLSAQNSNQVSVTGHITAEIISAFSAIETSELSFGRISPGPYGGEIILSPQGTVSFLGSVSKGSGFHNAASFSLTGDNNTAFSINLPNTVATLTNIANAKTMVVKNWISTPAPGILSGTLQDGFQTVFIGATLEVGTPSDNPVGIYKGAYTITFDFN